eukprot:1122257-Prymnesium_polylepis.1
MNYRGEVPTSSLYSAGWTRKKNDQYVVREQLALLCAACAAGGTGGCLSVARMSGPPEAEL